MMHNETFVAGSPRPGLPTGETAIRLRLANLVRHRRVLDMACANGRWTSVVSRWAESIVATDPCPAPLDLARRRDYDCRVSFASGIDGAVALQQAPQCLMASAAIARLGAGATLALIDRCLAACADDVVVILLESGHPSGRLLEALLPVARGLRVDRAEFVSLTSFRLSARPRPTLAAAAPISERQRH